MVKYCIVRGCTSGLASDRKNRVKNNLRQSSLFKVPKNNVLREKWAKALSQQLTLNQFVCEKHFREEDIKKADQIIINGAETIIPRERWTLLNDNVIPINLQDLEMDISEEQVPLVRNDINNCQIENLDCTQPSLQTFEGDDLREDSPSVGLHHMESPEIVTANDMWYLKACRACLDTKSKLKKIDEPSRRTFNVVTGLQLEEGDCLPYYFCAECYFYIKKLSHFRKKSRRAHFVLKEILAVKKQVTQRDVERVDRIKTNLLSHNSILDLKYATGYTYSTLDSHEDHEAPNIDPQVQEINTNSSEIIPTEGNFLKHNLNVINKSVILVDIKPASYKEIERREEEESKEREIEEVFKEISENDDNLNDNDAVEETREEVDLADVFKGLKEDSEVESEEEVFQEKENKEEEKKKKMCKMPVNVKINTIKALSNSDIKYMTYEEQVMKHNQRFKEEPYRFASFKCAICLTVYANMDKLNNHIQFHARKSQYQFLCAVCKDRFKNEDQLYRHCAFKHWYAYSCKKCGNEHDSFYKLMKCYEDGSTNKKYSSYNDEFFRKEFVMKPLSQNEFYSNMEKWTGPHSSKACHECRIGFPNVAGLKTHLKTHERPRKHSSYVICDVCKIYFSHTKFLTVHMENWHLYSFRCKKCGETSHNKTQARFHFKQKHQRRSDRTCKTCNEQFPNANSFLRHTSTAHQVDCNMCDKRAKSFENMYLHQLNDHGYIRLNTVPELNDENFKCVHCKIYFMDEKIYYAHLARMKHEEVGNYETGCVDCQILFDSEEEFTQHRSACPSSPAPMPCCYCDAVLKNLREYYNHFMKAHRDLPYKTEKGSTLCEMCGKCMKIGKMRAHKKAYHSDEAELKCRFCDVKVLTLPHYVSHMLLHHTLKPYCCTLCGTRFKQRCECRDHILKTHAPVKPYRCEVCDRRFSHLDFLNDHCVKVHNVNLKKTYKSQYLKQKYKGKIYVYPHMKIDGSLLDKSLLEKTNVDMYDYLDENNRKIDYKDCFFFDPTVDPNNPTRLDRPKQIIYKQLPEEKKEIIRKRDRENKKKRKAQRIIDKKINAKKSLADLLIKNQQLNNSFDEVKNNEIVKIELDFFGNPLVKTEEFVDFENQFDMKCDDSLMEVDMERAIETEDVMGELIEHNGEYYVVVDGLTYKLEANTVI